MEMTSTHVAGTPARARGQVSDAARDREAAAIALQVASLLLDYPAGGDADVALAAAALGALPAGEVRERLAGFVVWWRGLSARERETIYVQTFELGAKSSLYLTARRSRDKNERGRELLRLQDTYRRCGWEPSCSELPDYLPLMLEFAAAEPQGSELLQGERPALEGLRASLEAGGSPFAPVVAAVLIVAATAAAGGAPRVLEVSP
jgi:nitrate reductase molybdenum cofactor assembly chaperone NarJ/NarW